MTEITELEQRRAALEAERESLETKIVDGTQTDAITRYAAVTALLAGIPRRIAALRQNEASAARAEFLATIEQRVSEWNALKAKQGKLEAKAAAAQQRYLDAAQLATAARHEAEHAHRLLLGLSKKGEPYGLNVSAVLSHIKAAKESVTDHA